MTLVQALAPLLFAAFLWWFATGAILWLDRRPRSTFVWSFAAATVLATASVLALGLTARTETLAGAYLSFSAAVALWGWHEMSFLMGFITGPRRKPLPAGAAGWRRFRLATATVIHHEAAIAVTAAGVVALTWGQPNQVGTLTFLVLWALRLSAKFNLFLGAPYRAEDLLPPHLTHLASYFRHRRMNALFPVSAAGGLAAAYALSAAAYAPGASDITHAGLSLVLAMTLLGLVEHIFLFLPPPNQLLWGWAMTGDRNARRD